MTTASTVSFTLTLIGGWGCPVSRRMVGGSVAATLPQKAIPARTRPPGPATRTTPKTGIAGPGLVYAPLSRGRCDTAQRAFDGYRDPDFDPGDPARFDLFATAIALCRGDLTEATKTFPSSEPLDDADGDGVPDCEDADPDDATVTARTCCAASGRCSSS